MSTSRCVLCAFTFSSSASFRLLTHFFKQKIHAKNIDCGERAHCVKGECVCDEGYTGKAPDDCQLIGRFAVKANFISQTFVGDMTSKRTGQKARTKRMGGVG